MRRCKKEIDDKAWDVRYSSRVNRIGGIIDECRRTLDPHDFCPSNVDVCGIPDIYEVTIYGTDKEFNRCAEKVTARFPGLTSQFLRERTAKLSALLPFNGRSTSALSLATAWFTWGSHHLVLMHGTDALTHQHLAKCGLSSGSPVGEVTLENQVPIRGWRAGAPEFRFSEVASNIARRLILDCGEDPNRITLAEINSKSHRFAFSKNEGPIAAHSWRETVSTGFVGLPCRGLTTHHALPSSTTNFATPSRTTGFLDRTDAQSLCTTITHMTRRDRGAVSTVGGVTESRLPGSVI